MPVIRFQSKGRAFRQQRFAFFMEQIQSLPRPLHILDLGGTEAYWESMGLPEEDIVITLLNLEPISVKDSARFKAIQGDVCDLSLWPDHSIDLVYSNSVIEHLFTWEHQVKMANEVQRVGKNYFIQTPNYYFPIEPHWMLPGFQFLPKKIRQVITQTGNWGYIQRKKNREEALKQVEEVRLLTRREMQALFPKGNLYKEYWMGMVKSFCAYLISTENA